MCRKVFQVQVELCVHAITCPGVWLCPSGQLSLQMYMLDTCVQTSSAKPIFPLYFEEKFIFCKIFHKAQRLSDLQRLLTDECLYIELIQWTNCESGNVLATFIASLSDVLFPIKNEGVYAGIDVDLLMESSPTFPGIIAPKIEITTRTTIEECLLNKKYNALVVNPKVESSHLKSTKVPHLHQKKVCHSYGYHKSRKHCTCNKISKEKPPFVYRKAEEKLLSRQPKGLDRNESICKCKSNNLKISNVTDEFLQNLYTENKKSRSKHSCCDCLICAKYSNFFEKISNVTTKPIIASTRSNHNCACSNAQLATRQTKSYLDVKKANRNCASVVMRKSSSESCKSTEIDNYSSSPSSCCCCSNKLYTSGHRFQKRFYDSLEKFYESLYKKTQEKISHASKNFNVC